MQGSGSNNSITYIVNIDNNWTESTLNVYKNGRVDIILSSD